MDDERSDFAQKLRDDINKAIDELHDRPQHYNSHEEVVVEVLNALMDFHQERAFLFRTNVEGMARMVHEARERNRIEEKAGEYDAKHQSGAQEGDEKNLSANLTPDPKDIMDELQILEYIHLNKRPLNEWERNREKELTADLNAIQGMEAKLRERQAGERAELEKRQQDEVNSKGQTADRYTNHFHERIDQKFRFESERQSYVRDYYAGKQIRKEVEENEKKQTLQPDQAKLLH